MSEDKRNQMLRDIDEKKKRYERDAQDAQEELNQDQNKVLQAWPNVSTRSSRSTPRITGTR